MSNVSLRDLVEEEEEEEGGEEEEDEEECGGIENDGEAEEGVKELGGTGVKNGNTGGEYGALTLRENSEVDV